MAKEQTIDLRLPLHKYQMECALGRTRFTTLVCHRRFGKTEFGANLIVIEGMNNPRQYPPPQYAFISPQMNQATRNAWPKFVRMVSRLVPIGAAIKASINQLILPNGAIIHFIGADRNADSVRGMYFDGVVVDEIGDIKEDIWLDIIRPGLNDYRGWALFIGTPKGPNFFKKIRDRGYSKAAKDADWSTFEYPVAMTRGSFAWQTEEELRSTADDMGGEGSERWKREMECAFDVSPEEVYIPMSLTLACARRHPDPDTMKNLQPIFGVDVGRKDGDPCVLQIRKGSLCEEPIEYPGLDNMEAADVIAREINARNPKYVFIDMGAGQGVVDRLHQLGHRQRVIGIQFGSKNGILPGFLNKRAEMYGTVKKELKEGRLWLPPGSMALCEELSSATCWRTVKDQIQLQSKEEVRDKLGRSPDHADALVLTYAWPHAAQGVEGKRGDKAISNKEYDPYADIR
jgi:hypothetical protein